MTSRLDGKGSGGRSEWLSQHGVMLLERLFSLHSLTSTQKDDCGTPTLSVGGRIGVPTRFMQELARAVGQSAPRLLTWDDFVEAADTVEDAGHPDHRAFARQEVTEVELAAAYGYAIHDTGMPLARRTAIVGGAA